MRASLRLLGLAVVVLSSAVGCDDDGAPGPNDLGGDDLAAPGDLASGPDLIQPPDLAPACTQPTQGTVSAFRVSGVAIGSATPMPLTIALPEGHRARGTISLAGTLPTGWTVRGGVVTLTSADGSTTYDAVVSTPSGQGFTYEAFVPSGLYTVRALMSFNPGFIAGATVSSPSLVNVCGDTVTDLTIPALPTVTNKRVRTQGFSAVDPQPTTVTLRLERADGSFFVQRGGTPVPATSDNVYEFDQMPLPEGAMLLPTYELIRTPQSPGGYAVVLRADAPVTVGNMMDPFGDNLTLPTTVKLSGTINDPNSTLMPASANISHLIHCDPPPDPRPNAASYGEAFTNALTYALPVKSGVSCRVYGSFAIPLSMPVNDNIVGFLDQPKAPALVTIAAATTRNFDIPALAMPVSIAVNVRTAAGNTPINMASLTFESETLVAPAAANAKVTNPTGVTDSNGNVTVGLQPGTYAVTVRR